MNMGKILVVFLVAGSSVASVALGSESSDILYGKEATDLWSKMPIESQWPDDGWLWRQNATWTCKEFYNTDLKETQHECYKK